MLRPMLQASLITGQKGLTLSAKQQRIVFLEKIILPYVRQKLDDLHSKYLAQSAFSANKPHKIKAWIIEQGYPLIKKNNIFVRSIDKAVFPQRQNWLGIFLAVSFQY